MAALPNHQGFSPEPTATLPEARVLRWRPVAPVSEGRLADPEAREKLGPARGLLVGLVLGALLWVGLLIFAWHFFARA
jgi:hypothetical protein